MFESSRTFKISSFNKFSIPSPVKYAILRTQSPIITLMNRDGNLFPPLPPRFLLLSLLFKREKKRPAAAPNHPCRFKQRETNETSSAQKLFIGKSSGLYSCPTQLLKRSCDIISPVLANFHNKSVSLGAYPSKLIMFKVIPVYKADDETDACNYRPISLLSNFNRIFEYIMYNRINVFIHQLLSSSQYDFRQAHSTEHAILDMVESIRTNMDKRLFSCGVFIDLKKAFDTVDHKILLDKLNYYGFRGIINQWFSSYLIYRTQTTEINSHISDKEVVSCGVPQGSVLGPLLFLLYVGDIQYCSRKLKFFLFADDTNVLYSHENLKTYELIVNIELNNLFNWLTANKLTLNRNKSNFVIFRPYRRRLNYLSQVNIFDNEETKNVTLERKNCIKYLGLLIDENLSWKNHIHTLTTKISKKL